MRIVWQLLTVVAIWAGGGLTVQAVGGNPWLALVTGTVTAVLSVVAYRWIVGRTEHRPVTELSGDGAARTTALGTLLGAGLFAAVVVNLALLGDYRVDGIGSVSGAVGLVGFMAAAAVTEEVVFRGVLFRVVEERLGTWAALALTGAVFGLMHLSNPHADLWGAFTVAVEGGGMLAAAYAATGRLWLPIGLHFGWNFAGAGIFGAEVSGNGSSDGLLDASTSGPDLLTGGSFGPEGSVYSLVFTVLVTLVLLRTAHRRGRIVPRRGRRAEAAGARTTVAP
ncbi:CPBP family intramembrane glutamic endopeptidase [Streptomyces sp. NPDC001478]